MTGYQPIRDEYFLVTWMSVSENVIRSHDSGSTGRASAHVSGFLSMLRAAPSENMVLLILAENGVITIGSEKRTA